MLEETRLLHFMAHFLTIWADFLRHVFIFLGIVKVRKICRRVYSFAQTLQLFYGFKDIC